MEFAKKLIQKKNHSTNYIVIDTHPKQVFKNFLSLFTLIKAAGGLVHNEYNDCLFIFRKGKWDLPKGKIEKNEKKRMAAAREVEEECGIKVNEVGKRLLKTYHIYEQGNELIVKKTYWYSMSAKHDQLLIPQLEEGITDVRWIDKSQLAEIKENTYETVKDVLTFWQTAL